MWLAVAAAFFRMAYAPIISLGMRSWPMLKCSSGRWVGAPQSLSAGTSTTPRLSVSFRVLAIGGLLCTSRNVEPRGRQASTHGMVRCARAPPAMQARKANVYGARGTVGPTAAMTILLLVHLLGYAV